MTDSSTARVGYLGPPGSFTHEAASTLVGYGELEPYASVPRALSAVRRGAVTWALVPFENSVEGGVTGTLDDLGSMELPPLQIAREALLDVRFVLVARPGISLDQVRRVATHPHAEAQCRSWLAAAVPDAEVVMASSTSTAARDVAAGLYDAAITGPAAADIYGLDTLATDISDNAAAVTRFVLVGLPHPPAPPTGRDRTTVVLYEDEDHSGALLEMLTEFAARGVNLTRLESRPTGAGLGKYYFSLDCDGHIFDARVGETLAALHRICAEVRFLGSYVREGADPQEIRRGTSDGDFAEAKIWLDAVRRGERGV